MARVATRRLGCFVHTIVHRPSCVADENCEDRSHLAFVFPTFARRGRPTREIKLSMLAPHGPSALQHVPAVVEGDGARLQPESSGERHALALRSVGNPYLLQRSFDGSHIEHGGPRHHPISLFYSGLELFSDAALYLQQSPLGPNAEPKGWRDVTSGWSAVAVAVRPPAFGRSSQLGSCSTGCGGAGC
jgi:hypothetical protein